jgi:threonyl-tRNA synthetase
MSQVLDEKVGKMEADKKQLLSLRHTAEHVLHMAMQNLYPSLKKAMGPATEEGFYFDFDFDEKISESDFPKIEKEMQRIINLDLQMVHEEIDEKQAREIFGKNPYKNEWVDLILQRHEPLSVYKMVDKDGKIYEIDLCSGPHVASTSEVKAFKLLKIAGAYWHGDEKNKMLTRIYGTAFFSKEELEKYLWQIEEAKKRDHRTLGEKLGLFVLCPEVGPGLVLWAPHGATVRREIEKLIYDEQEKRGYKHVYTPHIGKKTLWQTSGHWDLYREKMYSPMQIDEEEYLVKPMNCPFHMMIYKSTPHSYRDLPLRIAEIASVYRYEKAGELSGMLRVRYITQDDSHIFCTPDQATLEFIGVFDYMAFLLKTFGIKDYYLRLGLRSPKEKYLGNDEVWQKAEEEIVKAVEKRGLKFVKSVGDAAFYGPKLDVIVKDALGREWQCGTIQLDFMLPERFELEYVDSDGKTKRPVLIHRAPLGSLERWMAILIEHYAGAFPLWLAPVQAVVIPISEKQGNYAQKVMAELVRAGIRVENRMESESMQKRIKLAQEQKVPYMLILGGKEEEQNKISIRKRNGEQDNMIDLHNFIAELKDKIASKSLR